MIFWQFLNIDTVVSYITTYLCLKKISCSNFQEILYFPTPIKFLTVKSLWYCSIILQQFSDHLPYRKQWPGFKQWLILSTIISMLVFLLTLIFPGDKAFNLLHLSWHKSSRSAIQLARKSSAVDHRTALNSCTVWICYVFAIPRGHHLQVLTLRTDISCFWSASMADRGVPSRKVNLKYLFLSKTNASYGGISGHSIQCITNIWHDISLILVTGCCLQLE